MICTENVRYKRCKRLKHRTAFTLIELSIVLVIIGLIAGGVLVGKDLIESAATRSQMSQIEQFKTAANTFKLKYGGLPGDIPNAQQFGFAARGPHPGEGNGDGVIEGNYSHSANSNGGLYMNGEIGTFWSDLSQSKLISGSYAANPMPGQIWVNLDAPFTAWLPSAAIGRDNTLIVWSGGWNNDSGSGRDGKNYLTVSKFPSIVNLWPRYTRPGMRVSEAFAIDSKMDDGLPYTGKVQALYITGIGVQHVSNDPASSYNSNWPGGNIASTSMSCQDNNNTLGVMPKYSMGQNSGSGINCALTFELN